MEAELILTRGKGNEISTIGKLTIGSLHMLTIEDAQQKKKIYGITRIPAGRYEIILRKEGRFHDLYAQKYTFHRGMLWLQDVPEFEYILIHVGNNAGDSSGCILVGSHQVGDNWVDDSEKAYLALYGYCLCLLDLGYKLFIKIIDNG